MRQTIHKGFTLVEILIVVVILGILAAIVIPQFASASTDALKGTLQTQLQTISSQLELYRVQHTGLYPANITTAANNNGWAEMIDENYLKEEPTNGYTGSTVLTDGVEADAIAATTATAAGWYFDNTAANATYGQVWAAGYDADTNTLEHE